MDSSLQHDEMVGEFVLVMGARREMLCQHAAAQLDGRDKPVAHLALGDICAQPGNRLIPNFGRNLFVDALISNDFGIMLGRGDEDEHACSFLGGVKITRQELLHCLATSLQSNNIEAVLRIMFKTKNKIQKTEAKNTIIKSL